jgi:hypothetical protein
VDARWTGIGAPREHTLKPGSEQLHRMNRRRTRRGHSSRITCEPLTSELDNLTLDPSVKRRAEAGTDVDPATDERRQVSLEGHEVQQGAPRLEIYEQVEVARVVGRLSGDGAENPQMARTVATSDRDDVCTS